MDMDNKERLLIRLDAIASSLAASGNGLALLALGSVGREVERLDEFSDLDFFAIVAEGCKTSYIENLSWLERVSPVGYAFKNSPDGYKLMFEDGILCEFAVFEEAELAAAVYAPGRVIWHAPGFNTSLFKEAPVLPVNQHQPVEWLVGEALTNLYVGLCRYRRGEKLSAMRFVQMYALDRVVELTKLVEPMQPGWVDVFSQERRFEQRFPLTAQNLSKMAQGYDRTPQSALVILEFLQKNFDVNPVIQREIVALCARIDGVTDTM